MILDTAAVFKFDHALFLTEENFRRAMALLGVTGYVLADMPERLAPFNPPAPTP